MYGRYGGYVVRLPRNPWLIIGGLVVAGVAASIIVALIVALLAVVAAAAVLVGGAWLAWRVTQLAIAPSVAALDSGSRRGSRRANREVRGLLELAATSDSMEQYLIAVREFERISMAALSLDPEHAGARRFRRRAFDLAEQAQNLDEAVTDLEHRVVADRTAGGARTHVWELALAVREVEQYLTTIASVRGAPTLSTLRALVAHRTTIRSRRTALVDRLEQVQVTRSLE
ncbi:MAG: hypothetical protein AB7R89_10695 [Dehalococcoidia bacterium]